MKIVCTIERKGGSSVKLDKKLYEFKPDKDGLHCCTVDNKAHIDRFLSIPESFKEYGSPDIEAPETDDDENAIDPGKMTNNELIVWAKEQGMNPKSKVSVSNYAADNYGLNFDGKVSIANMIRSCLIKDLVEV